MKFVEVKELPEKSTRRGAKFTIGYYLEEFMKRNIKIARVVEYSNLYSNSRNCQVSLQQSARINAFPIDVKVRNGDIYLVQRDI